MGEEKGPHELDFASKERIQCQRSWHTAFIDPWSGIPMEWLGLKHPLLVHLPLAATLLLPLPLLLAQRAGRGIRPWWVACRYLAWSGFLGLLISFPSGWAWAKAQGSPALLAPVGSALRLHQEWAAAGFLLGVATLWSLHRSRKDHEGLGWWAFLLGTSWSVVMIFQALGGLKLAHGRVVTAPPAPLVKVAPAVPDPERDRPVRALDYAALQPVQVDAVRSLSHGDRWVRTWVPASAAEAWAARQPLPPGTLVVLSSQEARWGRPGPEVGPLWAYEVGVGGKVEFQFYWATVPEERRADMNGLTRVYWRKGAPELQACLTCHAQGPSDPSQRARAFKVRR